MRKIVLDTSAIIKDPECYRTFGASDVFIPLTVIEELDNIKGRTGEKAAMARRFIKAMDAMSYDALIQYPGVRIGEGMGCLSVCICDEDLAEMHSGHSFDFSKADNQILSACVLVDSLYCKGEEYAVLVSEDRNLRFKARSIGIEACGCDDRCSDEQCGVHCIDDVPAGIIDDLFNSSAGIDPRLIGQLPSINEYLILRNGSLSALVSCCPDQLFRRVRKRDAFGITPRNAEQSFALDALLNPAIPLVALTGKAGTGKTVLAMAAALEQRSQYRQILMGKPLIPLGEDPGALPGDLKEKLGPWMQSFHDALSCIKHAGGKDQAEKIGKMVEDRKIITEPLSFIRGRSLEKVFLVVDECQNLTPHEIKTIVSRAGEGTKVVLAGDMRQIDNHKLDTDSNGLAHVVHRLQGQPLFAHIGLTKSERSPLAELAGDLL